MSRVHLSVRSSTDPPLCALLYGSTSLCTALRIHLSVHCSTDPPLCALLYGEGMNAELMGEYIEYCADR